MDSGSSALPVIMTDSGWIYFLKRTQIDIFSQLFFCQIRRGRGEEMLLGGYLTMEKLPGAMIIIFFYRLPEKWNISFFSAEGSSYISCTNGGSVSSSIIGYTECRCDIFFWGGGIKKSNFWVLLDSFSRRWKGRENYVFPQLLFQTIIFIGCFPFG